MIDDAAHRHASFATLLLSNGFKFLLSDERPGVLRRQQIDTAFIGNEYTSRGKARHSAFYAIYFVASLIAKDLARCK